MTRRWRGRKTVLAMGLTAAVLAGTMLAAPSREGAMLRLSTSDGSVLARVPLPEDRTFSLRYRNSLYRTLAEERFEVTDDGRLSLLDLAAEQLAVLEEYYAIDRRASRGAAGELAWSAEPGLAVIERQLRVAATDLGERTLLVEGAPPLELWRLVDDRSPTIILEAASSDG